MKTLLASIMLCIIANVVFAQHIVEYRYVNGKNYGIDSVGNFIQLNLGEHYYDNQPLPKSIKNYHPPMPKITNQDGTKSMNEKRDSTSSISISKRMKKSPAIHLKIAGGLFIAAGVFSVTGAILAGAGTVKGNKKMINAGIAIGSFSIGFTMGAGGSLITSGKGFQMKKL